MEFSNKFKAEFKTVTNQDSKYLTVLEVRKTLEEIDSDEARRLLDNFDRSHGAYIQIKKNPEKHI